MKIDFLKTLCGKLDVPPDAILWPKQKYSKTYLVQKRLFDVAFALIVIVILIPFFVLIYILIFLTSNGSPIIRQRRVGLGGKEFLMLKFRTMRFDVNLYDNCPVSDSDKRVTKIGRWLRKSSLDELPQLFHVVSGKMSLVGPRPEMPHIVQTYNEGERKRLEVLPGLTGLWQVYGRKDIPLRDNLKYDFYYITHQSFFFDIIILIRTFYVVLFGKGAY
jgi:lipopolysaccharide/colanic/teichoic acid biosynthesis glycosyltransferase